MTQKQQKQTPARVLWSRLATTSALGTLGAWALLGVLFFLDRRNGGSMSAPLSVREGLMLLGCLGAGLSVFCVWRMSISQHQLRALATVLTDLAGEKDPDKTLELAGTYPGGANMTEAGRGWNNVIAALDHLRQQYELLEAQDSMQGNGPAQSTVRAGQLLDALTDGVLLADSTGAITLVNRTCSGKLHAKCSDLTSKTILELFNDDEARTALAGLLDRSNPVSETRFDVTLSGAPIPKAPAEPEERAAVEDDAVTEEQEGPAAPAVIGGDDQAQNTVLRVHGRRLGDDLDGNDIVLIIRDVTQQVVSENSRDEFIAHVSHEFRSPLTNIRAYTETLLSDMVLDAEMQKEAFNVINDETNRLTRLVNDVLDLSQLETGSLTLARSEVALDRLIRQCVSDLTASAGNKHITLQTNYHPKLPNINADREKLAVVFNNLLTNAIKYTPEEGTVFVETNCDEQFVYVKVSDTGYGIAADDLERIFEKFYRVDRPETASITGSGLGLATTKEVVTLHGGSLSISSEINKGTEITARLPLQEVGPVLGPATS